MPNFFFKLILTFSLLSQIEKSAFAFDKDGPLTALQSALEANSRVLIGKPYIIDPLGEGPNGEFDSDPMIRWDGFDCTTFVETITAQSLSNSEFEMFDTLQKIRYSQEPHIFENRNHFPTVDWIQNNIKKGFFKDITWKVGKDITATVYATVTKKEWYEKLLPSRLGGISDLVAEEKIHILRKRGNRFIAEPTSLPYLRADFLKENPELLNSIPSGTVVNIVKPDLQTRSKAGTWILITHQGFLFWNSGELFLRHASTTGFVREDRLIDYFPTILHKSPNAGIHLLEIKADQKVGTLHSQEP